ADLFGSAVVQARAVYRERERSEGLDRRFKARVEDAQPGTSFEVYAGDYFVGTMTANALGRATLKLRSPQFLDDPSDGLPMPEDFPFLQTADTVAIGELSGVLFDQDVADSGDTQRYRLRGNLDGPTAMDGKVRYLERLRNGRLLRRFKVEVEDGTPGNLLDVLVNGTLVGVIEIDDMDEGRLELRSPEFIDDPGDGLPMPDDFPSLLPGDVVTVGPLQTVLALD
ncbi:MAG: hypothetical protein ACYTJ0_11360, partial [Planctomycetota bacterium]